MLQMHNDVLRNDRPALHRDRRGRKSWADGQAGPSHLPAAGGGTGGRQLTTAGSLSQQATRRAGRHAHAPFLFACVASRNTWYGSGSGLQMLTGDPQTDHLIEREFVHWAKAVALAQRLRTIRVADCQTRDYFALLAAGMHHTSRRGWDSPQGGCEKASRYQRQCFPM